MFETRKELQSQLEASQAEVARLEGELSIASDKVDESATLTQQVSELNEDLAACQTELKGEQEAHAATKESLEAEQAKTTPEAIQLLVAAEMAGAGVEPVAVADAEPEVAEQTDAELLSKYEKATTSELFTLKLSDPKTFARLRSIQN